MDPSTPEGWARLLKEEWEERAKSVSRDFFIASHPGWGSQESWNRQAAVDAGNMLALIDPAVVRGWNILEIGCGLGRLVPYVAPAGATYTGIDVSPTLIEEARTRHPAVANARFLVTDGLTIPDEARDRAYSLAFANAVFIHCPRDVTQSLLRSALGVLAPGGEIRFQLRGDARDHEGIVSMAEAEEGHQTTQTVAGLPIEDRSLIDERHYAGTAFTFAEAKRFLADLGDFTADVVRFDLHMIWCRLRKIS